MADRGKPRTVFSISKEFAHLSVLTNQFSSKKLLYLTDHHKFILRIWFLDNPYIHYPLEKFYWSIEPHSSELIGLAVDMRLLPPKLFVVSDSKKLGIKVDSLARDFKLHFAVSFVSGREFDKLPLEGLEILYRNASLLTIKNSGGSL